MLFHANYVSISVAGDYYQAMFAEEDTDDDSDRAYLIIQRQFEDLEDDTCYIETHDRKYSGHFLLRRIEFTPEGLSIEFDRPNDNLISVTFAWRRRSLRKRHRCSRSSAGRSSLSLNDTCPHAPALIGEAKVARVRPTRPQYVRYSSDYFRMGLPIESDAMCHLQTSHPRLRQHDSSLLDLRKDASFQFQ